MDSVVGRVGGKVLLTLHFTVPQFMLAFIREANTSQSSSTYSIGFGRLWVPISFACCSRWCSGIMAASLLTPLPLKWIRKMNIVLVSSTVILEPLTKSQQ